MLFSVFSVQCGEFSINSDVIMAEQMNELAIGSIAPDFRLAASSGGEVGLGDYRGKSAVALFFVREYI
jgi:hypothetical protein